ncbi:MAG: CRTAC1 family protein, partial [Acidobacteria bacterium]|nr:CRTAC1 family protein [Acidobacteriota bacterium]
RGDGTFEEVTQVAGPGSHPGATLGAVAADFNGDGWPDLYLANDQMSNELWINGHDGTFSEEGLLGGAALSGDGQPQASMGVDAGDFDGDGDEDLFLSHLSRETNTLYLNDGSAVFEDATARAGLAAPSWEYTGFGTAWFDYDNDGRLDLLVVNGAVKLLEPQVRAGEVLPLRQPDQLYHNLGGGRFEAVEVAGTALSTAKVSRGAAFGDLDDDGDIDVVVVDNGSAARLLENRVGAKSSWLGLRLVESHGRDALGAVVILHRADGGSILRRVSTAGSYASARDPRLVFGLDDGSPPERIEVRWPDGTRETWPAPSVGRYTTLHEGTGEVMH